MEDNNLINKLIGKKMIENAINLDESLAEILRLEVRKLKILMKTANSPEELLKTNNMIKNIIIALTLTEEKIKMGIDLCCSDTYKCDM